MRKSTSKEHSATFEKWLILNQHTYAPFTSVPLLLRARMQASICTTYRQELCTSTTNMLQEFARHALPVKTTTVVPFTATTRTNLMLSSNILRPNRNVQMEIRNYLHCQLEFTSTTPPPSMPYARNDELALGMIPIVRAELTASTPSYFP